MAITTNNLNAIQQQEIGTGNQYANQFSTQAGQQLTNANQQGQDNTNTLSALNGGLLSNTQNAPTLNGTNPINLPDFTSEGFTPDAYAALLGSNLDSQARSFDSQGNAMMQMLAQRGIVGGAGPGSGLAINPLTQLAASKAMANSDATRKAILANQQQIYNNRVNLSVPARQQALQAQQYQNQNALQLNDQQIANRNATTNALNAAVGGVQAGTGIQNAYGNALTPLISGYGSGLNSTSNSLNSLQQSKAAALTNDAQTGPMSVLGPLIGAGGAIAGKAI